jgi:hypothetical protein
MKKRLFLLTLAAVATVGMVACKTTANTSSVAASSAPVSSVAVSSSVAPSSSAYPDATVKLSIKTGVELEVGAKLTVKATVTTEADDRTVAFTFSDGAEDLLVIPDETDGVGSIALTGKAIGKVTITATSVVNPAAVATAEINVVSAKPTLQGAWKNIIKMKNYTFTGSTVATDGTETASLVTKVDTNVITTTKADGTAYYGNSTATVPYARIGEAIGKDNYALYLDKKTADSTYITPAVRVKAETGFLHADDFLGLGTSASSPNDVGLFYDLAAVNPGWLSNTKTTDNIYPIVGTTDDYYSAYVEVALWEIMDPASASAYAKTAADTKYTTLADGIDTSIKVVGVSDVVVTITLTSDSTKVFSGKISDVGTTSFAADTTLSAFLASDTCVSKLPDLNSDLVKGKAAVDTNNYVKANNFYPGHKSANLCTYYTYFTDTYYFNYIDNAFLANYKAKAGAAYDTSSDLNGGYLKKADGIYKFTFTNEVVTTNTDNTTTTTPASITVATTKEEGTDKDSTIADYVGYLSKTVIFSDDIYYSFTDSTTAISSINYHYTTNQNAFVALFNYMEQTNYPLSAFSGVYNDFTTFLGVTYAEDGSVSTFNLIGQFYDVSDKGYYSINTSLMKFGQGGTNDGNTLITAEIAKA